MFSHHMPIMKTILVKQALHKTSVIHEYEYMKKDFNLHRTTENMAGTYCKARRVFLKTSEDISFPRAIFYILDIQFILNGSLACTAREPARFISLTWELIA